MRNIRKLPFVIIAYIIGISFDAVAGKKCQTVFAESETKWNEVFSLYHEVVLELIEADKEYTKAKVLWDEQRKKWKTQNFQLGYFIEGDFKANSNEVQKTVQDLEQYSEKLHKSFTKWKKASIKWNQTHRELTALMQESTMP